MGLRKLLSSFIPRERPADEARATPENPRFSLYDPLAWDALGARASSSGVRVDAVSALTYSPWWRGVSMISRDVGKLPLIQYRRVGAGRERATDEPGYRLMRRKPNPYQTDLQFKMQLTGHALNRGNGYGCILRAPDMAPLEVLPLDPSKVTPVRENGVNWYVVDLGTEERRVPAVNMLHIRGFGFDGFQGYPAYMKAQDTIGLGLAAERFGARFFENGAVPRFVLETAASLPEKEAARLRKSWESMQTGLENAHRTAILSHGLSAKAITSSAEDSQLHETREAQIREVSNWLGVPPHKLGDTTRSSYASVEEENQAYLDDALDFWLSNWESECWDKLLTERQKARETHWFEFPRRKLVRGDLAARQSYYATAVLNGWMSRDEVREEEGENPIAGGEGSRYFVPQNVTLTEAVGSGEDEEEAPGAAAAGAGGAEVLALPDVRQAGPSDCGAAAVASVCGFLGRGPATLADAVAALGTTAAGTSPGQVLACLSAAGLCVTGASGMTVEDLREAFEGGRPTLVPCQADDGKGGAAGHWLAVSGVGLGMVFVQDPAAGPRMIPAAAFDAAWRDSDPAGNAFDHFGVVVGLAMPEPPEPEDDPEGDDAPAPKPGDPKPAPDAADKARADRLAEALRRAAGATALRMVRRVASHLRRAAQAPGRFLAELEALEEQHGRTVGEAFAPLFGVETPHGREFLGEVRAEMLALSGEARAPELAARVESKLSEWEAEPRRLRSLDLLTQVVA